MRLGLDHHLHTFFASWAGKEGPIQFNSQWLSEAVVTPVIFIIQLCQDALGDSDTKNLI